MSDQKNEPTDLAHPAGPDQLDAVMASLGDDESVVVRNEPTGVAAINRSELETQLDAAHRYPRSIQRFLRKASGEATLTPQVAEMCMYSLPRGGKKIVGPSVRLAEICAAAYGNIHAGARPIDVGHGDVTSQGIAWDLETNFRVTIEAKRKILDKDNRRFNEDMILMTQNAATSIAFRNAIFRVIPRSYINIIFDRVRAVATGGSMGLAAKRKEIFDRLAAKGVEAPRVLGALGKAGIDDVTLEDVEHLIGVGTAIAQGSTTLEEAFPPGQAPLPVGDAKAGDDGRRIKLGKTKAGGAVQGAAPAPAAKPEAPPADDPDAADRAAAAPTAEELAARDKGKA